MSKERILVTGAGGVLGQAFRAISGDYPEYEWVFWTSRDCNLTNPDDTNCMVMAFTPDYIIHCAAKSGGVGLSKKAPASLLRDNVLMSINILEAARFANVKKVIMTLSGGMYSPPVASEKPRCEYAVHLGPPHTSNYAYAHAKRLIEPMIRAYREEYGMNVIGLVPDAMYGEGDNYNLEDCNMTAALIRKFYEASKIGGNVEVWGDGSPYRQLSYARDVARAYMAMLVGYDEGGIVNVATDEVVQVWEVSGNLCKISGIPKHKVRYNPNKPNGPAYKVLDTTRFKSLCPDFKWTPLSEGLEKTYKWYAQMMVEEPEGIRKGGKV